MSNTLDALNSSLASTLRFWRGTNARPAARQPKKPLELYEFEACPYCRLVREALTEPAEVTTRKQFDDTMASIANGR